MYHRRPTYSTAIRLSFLSTVNNDSRTPAPLHIDTACRIFFVRTDVRLYVLCFISLTRDRCFQRAGRKILRFDENQPEAFVLHPRGYPRQRKILRAVYRENPRLNLCVATRRRIRRFPSGIINKRRAEDRAAYDGRETILIRRETIFNWTR